MAKTPKVAAASTQAALDELKTAAPDDKGGAEMAGPAGAIVLGRGPEDGRRRGGLTFGPVDIEIDLGAITRAAMQAILDDPHITIRPKPVEAAEA